MCKHHIQIHCVAVKLTVLKVGLCPAAHRSLTAVIQLRPTGGRRFKFLTPGTRQEVTWTP